MALVLFQASVYRDDLNELNSLRIAEVTKYTQSYATAFTILQRERKLAKERFAELERANADLVAERDGMHNDLTRLQARLSALPPSDCCRRVKELTELSDRAFNVASRCSADLARQHEALRTCVRAYEEVKIVHDSAK